MLWQRTRILIWSLIFVLLMIPVAAQEETTPLLETLQLIPDTVQTRAGIPLLSFADYRAMESARGIVPAPTVADFADGTEVSELWIAATRGLVSGMDLSYLFAYLNGMEEAVGFGWFDINRATVFGQPPSFGTIVQANFNPLAVAAAYEARDYVADKRDNVTIWCPAAGCEEGQMLNLANRNSANPFGGHLGRSELAAVLPDYILNSPDHVVMSEMVSVAVNDARSFADRQDFQTIATFIATKGTLRQTHVYNGTDIGLADGGIQIPATDQSAPLPAYSLIFFADTFTEDQQIALIGLLYPDAGLAQDAADLLGANLETAQSTLSPISFQDLIRERGGEIMATYVEENDATGQAIAVLEIHYPMPSNELQDDGTFQPSSSVFQLLIQAVFRRDIHWLRIAQ